MRSNVKNLKSLCGTSYMLTIDTTVVRIIVSNTCSTCCWLWLGSPSNSQLIFITELQIKMVELEFVQLKDESLVIAITAT